MKHFCNQVVSGTRVLQYKEKGGRIICLLLLSLTPEGKYLIVAGNYGDVAQQMTVQLGGEAFKCNFTGTFFLIRLL